MKHWIIDFDNEPLPSWRVAMPEALVLHREAATNVASDEAGIVWCRLRSGELPETILPRIVRGPKQALVLLCDEPEDALIAQAMAMGASGCCNSRAAPEVLAQVALVVANGGLWVGQSLLQRLVATTAGVLAQQRPAEAKKDEWAVHLSEREAQVAHLVAGGASNKEIAQQLFITERTVKAHMTAIFEKTGVRDRLQLSLKINGMSI